MANVAVIGAQWGDEGKGKIVDWLSERAEVVVRFQGGHNAGHTLVIGNQTYKLALLPSGVVRKGKLSIIGNGVVVDPWHFLEEVKKVSGQGVSVTPWLDTFFTSSRKCQGSTTTPLPMMESLPLRTTPDGSRASL